MTTATPRQVHGTPGELTEVGLAQPSPQETDTRRESKNGSHPYWNSVAEAWVQSHLHGLWRTHSDAVNIALLEPWLAGVKAKRILKTDAFDEATSAGLYPLLARHAREVHTIDVSSVVLQSARQRYPDLQATGADARSLPFASGYFDVVVSNSTLDHFDDRRQIDQSLRELFRVLRPGGQLLLTLDNLANPLVALRSVLPFPLLNRLHLLPYRVGATCRPKALITAVESAGFKIEQTTAILHCPRVLAVACAALIERLGGPRMQRAYLRQLMRFERLARWPTRFLTGYFIAIRAVARPLPLEALSSALKASALGVGFDELEPEGGLVAAHQIDPRDSIVQDRTTTEIG